MTRKLPVYFAPLQGYTDAVYRNAHSLYFGGVEAYYTPFVRLEKGSFRNKDLKDISIDNNHVSSLVPQLIAAEPEETREIISLFVGEGYKEIDINLGCPFPLIVRKKKGSGLLPYPEKVKDILDTILDYPDISFSVKLRLGLHSPDECLNLLPVLNEFPLKHIAMHPRLGIQQYKSTVDMESFGQFYDKCNHPLIYNGDISIAEDISRIAQLYPKLSGIMIGRGLLTNPALALEYTNGTKLSSDEFLERMMQMHSYALNQYRKQIEGGETQLLNKMKVFWEYPGMRMDRKVMKKIMKCKDIDALINIVNTTLSF